MGKDQILSTLRRKLSNLEAVVSHEKRRQEVRYSIGLIEGAALSGLLDIDSQRVLLTELFAINDVVEKRLEGTSDAANGPDNP